MPSKPRPARVVFGKGSAARQMAKKRAHEQPFRDAYAVAEGRADDDAADFAAAVRRGLGIDDDDDE